MKNTDLGRKDERLFVYLKVKEPSENDRLYYDISQDKKLISLHDKIIKNESSKTQRIEVDKVFDDSDNVENIYQEMSKHCINDCLQRKNYTYIFYGDSTSEKNEIFFGNEKNVKGFYYLLLKDLHKAMKQASELTLNLSFLMVNGSILIDLTQLMEKKKHLDSLSERDLINKFGKEININDTDIIKDITKTQNDNVEENSKFIKNLFMTLKKMEENEGNRFISCSYFCFIFYIINKRTKRTISTVNCIIIPGNELLTTKITNPNNAKRDNISNTKNVVELSYTIEDIVRHLSTQSISEKNDTENMNKSKFMAVIGKIAFDVGNLDHQFNRRYRILGSIFANTGLYYNTKDTLYFLFRCKKITRQKIDYEMALSLLEQDKKRTSRKFYLEGSSKDNLIINSKNELEEKLKLKDDQIYDLESKLKLQETKVAELNSRIEKKDENLKAIRNNYKMQIDCLKESMGFKGDVNILLSKDQYTKEYRYALNIRNTFKINRKKAEIIEKLEEKIKELNKEKARLKEMLENKTKEKKILRIINSNGDYKTDEESEEMEEKIYFKNKTIQELQKRNEELEKQLELYNQENNSKISLIHNLPKVIDSNITKLKTETIKIKEENEKNKKKFIEEAKNINTKSEEERQKIISNYEKTLKQNKKEISNQGKIINEFEQKYSKEKSKVIDELLRLHKNLMNITYGYKNSFNDINPNILHKNINNATTNATSILYMKKDEFEKILENEIKQINKNKYPLLFEYLKQKNENFVDIIINGNNDIKEEKLNMTKKSEIRDESEEKQSFKFFEAHEKKTEIEIENMNKNQLIHYNKKFLERAAQIEEYLNNYIHYKKGYKLSEEEEAKISDYSNKLERANEILDDITEKYNKSKVYLQKNEQLINQLTKENTSLKKALNNILLMEKLTNPNKFLKMNSNKLNKKKYENNMFDFQAHMTFDKNFGPNFSNFDKESKKTFTKFISDQNNIQNSIRCNTYDNSQKNMKITFNNVNRNRPFSSFQHIKQYKKK